MRHRPSLTGVDHPTYRFMTSNYTPDMLSCYPEYWNEELELWSPSIMEWSKDNYLDIDMLSHCFMSDIWVIDYVWQRWIPPQTIAWPPTVPQTYSAVVTLNIGTKKNLNHGPHQWCSGLRTMMQVWICYPTVIWVLYESWTTSDRGGSPHRPQHNHKLYPRHTQLLPWKLEPIGQEVEPWSSSVV